MKKTLLLVCALTMIGTGSQLQAQALNGMYTLDDTQPASATNFTSFTHLAATINTAGVSGPVTVNVGATSGPYVEQVQFLQFSGASSTNSVVINGNGRTITYGAGSTALKATILMSGTDYLTINNLTVSATNATNAFAVHLWDAADNNNFNNCEFNSPLSGTGTGLCPFSVSGSSVTVASGGDGGDNNSVNTCTTNGGYYGIVFYSNTTANNSDNKAINCLVRDFYSTGILTEQCDFTLIQDNVIERPVRTTVTTSEGIDIGTGSLACIIERNHIRNLFGGLTSSSTAYAIYCNADATLGNENIIRNNVVSHMVSNGTQGGIYATSAEFTHILHNTIVLDDANSTAGTTYGIFVTGPNNTIINNLIYITRGGTGLKNALDMTTAALPGLVMDHNVYYLNPPTGTTNHADVSGTMYATLAAWQSGTGYDLNSISADPVFANPATYDFSPTSLTVNNTGLPIGVLDDYNQASRSTWAPDAGAFEAFNSPCSGIPPTNSLTLSNVTVCPGANLEIQLLSTGIYTNSGYQVQWHSSTLTSVGGFSAIPGATLPALSTGTILGTIYYHAVVTCSYNNQTSATPVTTVYVAPATVDNIPYYEGFETLSLNDLPNCSWSATNQYDVTFTGQGPQSDSRLPHTGSNYAYFDNSPAGTNYFFTNAINMNSGVTYSAALWYITNNVDFSEWDDLSILVGTSQNPGSMVTVATASPVTGNLYNLLSSTFTVPVTGQYFVAVRGTPSGGSAPYLTWDDLSITIPCSLNSPTLAVLSSSASICLNDDVQLTASGADTYSWSTGASGAQTSDKPSETTQYIVTGVHAASGCTSTLSTLVVVKPVPQISTFANDYAICIGETAVLSAAGADNFYWTSGVSGATAAVSPTATTVYSVSGTNSVGCSSYATVTITVNSPLQVAAVASATDVCIGDLVTLDAQGAITYTWSALQLFVQASQATVMPQSSGIYTLTSIDANGCTTIQTIVLNVNECTSLGENNSRTALRVFPNPTTGNVTVQGKGAAEIRVTDIAGRIVYTSASTLDSDVIEMGHLAAGIYYLRLAGDGASQVIKIIKE